MNKASKERLLNVNEKLVYVFVEADKNSPVKFEISHGYRSKAEQYELYKQGRTISGKIVTFKNGYQEMSNHNYFPSRAVDVVCYIDNKVTWSSLIYITLAEHILKVAKDLNIPIVWGGNFKKLKDYCHYEIKI